MNKFFGPLGFAEGTTETAPGVHKENIVEHNYYGDVITFSRRLSQGEAINDNIALTNTIEIVADAYAMNHFFNIRYICWQGAKWKVSDVSVAAPRLKLTLGGLYHESS